MVINILNSMEHYSTIIQPHEGYLHYHLTVDDNEPEPEPAVFSGVGDEEEFPPLQLSQRQKRSEVFQQKILQQQHQEILLQQQQQPAINNLNDLAEPHQDGNLGRAAGQEDKSHETVSSNGLAHPSTPMAMGDSRIRRTKLGKGAVATHLMMELTYNLRTKR